MQTKCKQTPPFLSQSQGAMVCQLPASRPPCLARGSTWLAEQVRSWATSHPAAVESPTENPQTRLFSLWCRTVIWKRICSLSFFSRYIWVIFPPLFSLLFLLVLNYPSLNPSCSNPMGYFKRLLAHQMQVSEGLLEKITITVSVPPAAKSHHESYFWLNWQKYLI